MKRLFILGVCMLTVCSLAATVWAQAGEPGPNDEGYIVQTPELFNPITISYGSGLTPQAPGDSVCDCIDLVLVIDDTGSMGGAIANVKAGISNILALAQSTCGSVQASLISFKDNVEVDQPLTFNLAMVQTAINGLFASGGAGGPEASDQAIKEAVFGPGTDCAKIGDFLTSAYRDTCCKVVIMVTDNLPGGCNDVYTVGVDDVHANLVANIANNAGIKIGAVQVGTFAAVTPIMQNYASTTGGVFGQVPFTGAGTDAAIQQIILDCIGAGATELCCLPAAGCVEVLAGTCVPSGGFVVSSCADCTISVEEKSWGGIKELYKTDE